eukprot:3638228-Rhodomonas_salina.2
MCCAATRRDGNGKRCTRYTLYTLYTLDSRLSTLLPTCSYTLYPAPQTLGPTPSIRDSRPWELTSWMGVVAGVHVHYSDKGGRSPSIVRSVLSECLVTCGGP